MLVRGCKSEHRTILTMRVSLLSLTRDFSDYSSSCDGVDVELMHVIVARFFFILIDKLLRTNSVVAIATRYGLDGPGIESRWEARFSAPVQTGSGAHLASYVVGTGSFTLG